jgi:hypothetical protein
MTHQEFDVLVQQVESDIGRDPDRLRKKVAGLAIIGFAGVLAPVGIVLLFASAFVIPQLLWAREAWGLSVIAGLILLIGGWLALRPLFVRLPPPEGRKVTRTEAPALFADLDELRAHLRSAPFHHVLFIPECNAAVAQRPRLGVFGWYRNYLLIGLPLMEALS